MSSLSDFDLDLEHLFQPAWAQGKAEANRFEQYIGDEGVKPERRIKREGERRGPRRESPGGESSGEWRGPRPPRSGSKFSDRKKGFDRRDDRREGERIEPPAPLPEVSVSFLPDEKGVESVARQIKMTGRAYPLFDIARLILQKPERYAVRLSVKKAAAQAPSPVQTEETPGRDARTASGVAQPLFICALDDTPWLSEDEAVAHVLKKHFATFYQTERTPTEPPKGKYTFVAQCGMSGVIIGPPNYHDYQNQLRKLHAERFARMPFDAFKARVKIVKDEAVVKKWVEEQSFKTEYVVLNVPEPLKLPNLDEVEKHFRATHKETIIKSVERHTVAGAPSRNLLCRELYRLIRADWEQQRRFPLQLATELSKQLAAHGLQFFKVNKTVVHVSVARPQFLDLETTPVSENIKRIIAHINAHPKCKHRELIEALAPSPAVIEIKPATETPPGTEPHLQTVGPGESPKGGTSNAEPTPEQTTIIADLHWLIHQGHVLEFADGRMETAKKPLPKPPKPEKKPAEGKAAPVTESALRTETVDETAAEIQSMPTAIAGTQTSAEKPATEIPVPVETAAPASEIAPSDEVPSPS